jgi:hypothetical protein
MLGAESTLSWEANDYINEFMNYQKTPPCKKVGGKPEARRILFYLLGGFSQTTNLKLSWAYSS